MKTRNEVPLKDQWNVELLYPSLEAWSADFSLIIPKETPRWSALTAFQGTLCQGAGQIKKLLDLYFSLHRSLTKLYTYAHLRHDEDITNPETKIAYNNALSAFYAFQETCSWIEPELLALPEKAAQELIKNPLLSLYHTYLERLFRLRAHILSQESEQLLALSQKPLSSMRKAFGAINDADFSFGTVADNNGHNHELTHARFSLLLRSHDSVLRQNAFETYFKKYQKYQNTLCELLVGNIESHVFQAKARRFSSSLESALFPQNIAPSVYHSLIDAVRQRLPLLHRYMALRSKALHRTPLHFFDLQVPLTKNFDPKIPYNEAEALVIESVSPLGSEYQELLKEGLTQQRWVDRYENRNKHSGAYSSGCYDSFPYILMNYKETIRDLFTLAHEAGHSMHSLLSHRTQPYPYANYSIFVAEVASTFNEDLLMRLMLRRAKTNEEKAFLLTQKIEDIRATLFRQTLFAEFELAVHSWIDAGLAITPQKLEETYAKLCQEYYGPAMASDPLIGVEWARIPHFYANFYVYQYATGISAALALANKVVTGDAQARAHYLDFLKSGNSLYPVEALKQAGVDMCTTEPVDSALNLFGSLLDQLEPLI